jgi:hypothetical protein
MKGGQLASEFVADSLADKSHPSARLDAPRRRGDAPRQVAHGRRAPGRAGLPQQPIQSFVA